MRKEKNGKKLMGSCEKMDQSCQKIHRKWYHIRKNGKMRR
jgi:hypothetical protein